MLNWLSDDGNNRRKSLVDAGCGVGSLSIPASSIFNKVYASDISKSMTEEAALRAKNLGIKNVDFKVNIRKSSLCSG